MAGREREPWENGMVIVCGDCGQMLYPTNIQVKRLYCKKCKKQVDVREEPGYGLYH